MKERTDSIMRGVLSVLVLALASVPTLEASDASSQSAKPGILFLAHGGRPSWNDRVLELVSKVDARQPAEVAFGMATRAAMQAAIDRLVARGVTEIVAVPLFVSSHSSVVTSTEYLLGLRAEAPRDLAIFAKMDHGSHGGTASHASHTAATVDPTSPIASPVPIRITAALNAHPVVGAILASRARAISQDPAREAVVIVAHGPVPEDDNRRWLDDMKVSAERVRGEVPFRSVDYLTVRDDAPAAIRDAATAELRALVQRRAKEGNRILVIPQLLSYGGIEQGIRKRLEGLDYTMAEQGLVPDDRLVGWVLEMAVSSISDRPR
jgi:sirohydrochlorin ferrochelatase